MTGDMPATKAPVLISGLKLGSSFIVAGDTIAVDGKISVTAPLDFFEYPLRSDSGDTLGIGQAVVSLILPGSGIAEWDLRTDARMKIITSAGLAPGPYSLTLFAGAGNSSDYRSVRFTVVDPYEGRLIKVDSPNGGESYRVGDTLWTKWSVKEFAQDPLDAIDVQLSPDDGHTWVYLVTGSIRPASPRWGNLDWVIRDSVYSLSTGEGFALAGNPNCRIRVRQYSTADPMREDASDGKFTILAK